LAAGILSHLDRIDAVEVIADDVFDAPRAQLRALRTLASQVPVVLHGVGLGLASAARVDRRRLEAMARVVDAVVPDFWSEHLAFVRAGGVEIGHLAAPPRNAATLDGLARNVAAARAIVGRAPLLENVATWVAAAVDAADSDLLLDLHNLHANATNFGFDAQAFLDRLPTERIAAIHLAGGRWIRADSGERRLLDDHLHDVPDPVFALLAEVGRRAPQPLTVILERDGRYPAIDHLLAELDCAREALERGRKQRAVEKGA
jgi:uncharacterized protein (UPF0276 family)